MGRACIFCGNEGQASAEHVFPNWLNGIFPSTDVGQTDVHRVVVEPDVEPAYRSYTKQDVASLTTKHLCAPCNNGWLSVLEAESKPLLVPLMRGESRSLTMPEQLVLAAWAVKTTMVLETTWAKIR